MRVTAMVYKCRVPRITDDTFLARKKGIVRVGGGIDFYIDLDRKEGNCGFFSAVFRDWNSKLGSIKNRDCFDRSLVKINLVNYLLFTFSTINYSK